MPWEYWNYAVLAVVLVVAAVTDIRSGRIYNKVTYPAFAAGLLGHALVGGLTGGEYGLGLLGALAGAAIGAVLLPAWLAGGIGGGDAKLMIAVGALAGWSFTLSAIFWGFAVAAIMALAVMLRRRIVRRTLGRIGRVLYLALTPGKAGDPTTEDSPKIPFGLALCIGAGLALAEALVLGRPVIQIAIES